VGGVIHYVEGTLEAVICFLQVRGLASRGRPRKG